MAYGSRRRFVEVNLNDTIAHGLMIRHPLTIERVASALHETLHGRVLVDAWTQQSNELVLRWSARPREDDDLYIVVSVDPRDPCVYEQPHTRRQRRNATSILPDAIGQTCHLVTKVEGDRIVTLLLNQDRLHILLFTGPTSNVVLERNGTLIDALHDRRNVVGTTLTPSQLPLHLGPHLTEEQKHHAEPVSELARNSEYFYILERDHAVLFSLLPLHGWSVLEQHNSILNAIRRTIIIRRQREQLTTLRRSVMSSLRQRRDKQQRMVQNMMSDAAQHDRASEYRHLADVLMSHAHNVHIASHTVVIQDWDGSMLTINVKPELSAIENAQRYYAKARQAEGRLQSLRQRLPSAQERLVELDALLQQAESCTTIECLQSLQDTRTDRTRSANKPLFRVFDLSQGYTLYVGRTAANNDQLTMQFAKPSDYWFHARGVSGSHCILRSATHQTTVATAILEQAASIAAYYSSARNGTWVPVSYTQRKYVRKPKGAAIGAVVMEREEVLLVQPRQPIAESAAERGAD